jgi:hypothetical protein
MTTEAAKVFLVPAETTLNKEAIEQAALAETEVNAYSQGKLATSGLVAGDYVVYAIDSSDNISEASKLITIENPVNADIISNITRIKITYNPLIETININSSDELRQINIYNILGKKVLSKTLNGTFCDLNASEFYSGIYLVQVFDWHQNMERTKILIE